MTSKNPAPTATNPVTDRRVQPDGPLSGEVQRGGDTSEGSEPSALADLIARVEAATEGSAELDIRILAELLCEQPVAVKQSPINGAWCAYVKDYKGRENLWNTPSPFRQMEAGPSRSLDAALGLAERCLPGCDWVAGPKKASIWPNFTELTDDPVDAYAPTPALALCLAVLKAKVGER